MNLKCLLLALQLLLLPLTGLPVNAAGGAQLTSVWDKMPQHPVHTDHSFSSSNRSRGERVCLIDAKEPSCSIQVATTHTEAVAYWLAWSGGLVVNGLKDGEIFKQRPQNWARFRGHHGEKC